jgi:hypothetical protein
MQSPMSNSFGHILCAALNEWFGDPGQLPWPVKEFDG